ncbi:DUF1707 domain-containing protein [Nocardioides sp. 616]|uniref:DUF1707 SHOCT-like domain-containing protein n=1 Tax=Nocardioides sp. 616 TaxID=2268090 RepID=UPI000CE3F87B|nr:DUF1707 domain-containing protein [Nocardioides sp. 616]
MSEHDPSQLRISDADRHRVAEVLREAAAEGRIDLEELDERLETAYAAKVYADLVPITIDLPGDSRLPVPAQPQPQPRPMAVPDGLPAAEYPTSIAVMGGVDRKGVWQVGESHTAVAVMGGICIDLRQARFTSHETVINAYTFWGGIDVLVNAGTRVIVDGVGIMGAFEQGRDKVAPDIGPDAPVVRVKGFALMGAVSVTRKAMPGEPGPLRRKMLGH